MQTRGRLVAIAYLTLQGIGALVWWVALLAGWIPRRWFWPRTDFLEGLWAFFLPDALIFVAGSLVAAYGLSRRASWERAAVMLVAGGTLYAGMYSEVLAFLTQEAWLGAVLMVPPMIVPPWIAWRLAR